MPSEYLVDGLYPSNEISFVFGSPGSGKSSFLCVVAQCIVERRPFAFGNNVYDVDPNVKIGYAAFDRSRTSILKLLRKYDLHNKIPWHSYRNVHTPDGSDSRKIADIPKDFPGCNALILDGLGLTIPTGKTNDYCTVGNYVRYCGTVAEEAGVTFLAVLHSPKPRIGEGIANPRMGALGSTAFPGIAEAMTQVEHVDLTNPEDPNRLIRIMPHDGASIQSTWAFDSKGILVECQDPMVEADDNDMRFSLLTLFPKFFSSSQAIQIADGLGVSRRSTYRYLTDLVEMGKIIQVSWGKYEKVGDDEFST